MSCDAYHMTAPHPEGLGARNCMREAIKDAGIEPKDIDHINTHGTSTPVGDVAEPKAIVSLFGADSQVLINSTKSMTGHLLGATGAIEFIALCLTLKHQIIPPTINYEEPDPDCDLNYTPNRAVERKITNGLSNNFGFGGHNAVLAAKKFES